MRGIDLTTDGEVWEYRPRKHKSMHRGHDWVVLIGPRGQAVLRPLLKDDPAAPVFQGVRHDGSTGQYARGSYCQAVSRACDRAFPHPTLADVRRSDLTPAQKAELSAWQKAHRWSPLRLRHSTATRVRSSHGLEASQVILGHSRADVTQVYAQRDMAKAIEVAVAIS
ncbi:MAG TPA: hypothetical protein VGH33_20645 [Isosphaeraceae bacterium]|jgi:integrase